MNRDEGANTPMKESEVFSTLERISRKLESLEKILQPILSANELTSEKMANSGTELVSALRNVEEKVTNLLDRVVL